MLKDLACRYANRSSTKQSPILTISNKTFSEQAEMVDPLEGVLELSSLGF
jgi:hypothetical protein